MLFIVTHNLAVIRREVKSLGMTAECEFKHQHKQDTGRRLRIPRQQGSGTVRIMFAVAAASWALDIDD